MPLPLEEEEETVSRPQDTGKDTLTLGKSRAPPK